MLEVTTAGRQGGDVVYSNAGHCDSNVKMWRRGKCCYRQGGCPVYDNAGH